MLLSARTTGGHFRDVSASILHWISPFFFGVFMAFFLMATFLPIKFPRSASTFGVFFVHFSDFFLDFFFYFYVFFGADGGRPQRRRNDRRKKIK